MILKNNHLSSFTTLRIGGPASALFEASDPDAVVLSARRAESIGLPWRVIGQGSNILASDAGVAGAVIVFHGGEAPQAGPEGLVRVLGSTLLDDLVGFMVERGLGGLEALAGIPGTVGGAICGNAGAYGTAIGERISRVTLLGRGGEVREVNARELEFGYRHSIIKESREAVLEALIEARPADPAVLRKTMKEKQSDRAAKHPNHRVTPTAGSWFKNIRQSDGTMTAAGRLLDEAGCRELVVGGASLWPRHANIVVTDGRATFAEVDALVSEMARRVEERFDIKLVEEVCRLAPPAKAPA